MRPFGIKGELELERQNGNSGLKHCGASIVRRTRTGCLKVMSLSSSIISNGTYHFARSMPGVTFRDTIFRTDAAARRRVMANESSLSPDISAEAQMNTLRFAFITTQAMAVAARLGLADLVAAAPQTVEELARKTRTHAPSLRRLLQFLASLAIFEEDAAGKYRQTALSETLRKDAP
jgi:hypothetical protein